MIQTRFLAAAIVSFCLAACSDEKPVAEDDNQSIPAAQVESIEGLLGRWCFRQGTIPSIWYVVELVEGPETVAVSYFADGSQREERLEALPSGRLQKVENSFGEAYQINTAGGLAAYDEDGLIATGQPMEPQSPNAECWTR